MTTGESTDKIDKIEKTGNLTLTSDASYERVTSDEHFEDERDGGFLKQNTSGLVQEIPNISFLDIGDTLLESKKTLDDKKNWNIVVGTKGKSIEAIPQDSLNLRLGDNQSVPQGGAVVAFDTYDITDDSNIMKLESPGKIKILEDGYYRISYGRTIDIGSTTQLIIVIFQNTTEITGDDLRGVTGVRLSGGRTINASLSKGDYIQMGVASNNSVTVMEKYTYLQIQYIGKSI